MYTKDNLTLANRSRHSSNVYITRILEIYAWLLFYVWLNTQTLEDFSSILDLDFKCESLFFYNLLVQSGIHSVLRFLYIVKTLRTCTAKFIFTMQCTNSKYYKSFTFICTS